MSGTIEMKTDSLVLRRHQSEDAEVLFEIFGSDPQMFEYSGWNPYQTYAMAVETVESFIKNYDDPHFYGYRDSDKAGFAEKYKMYKLKFMFDWGSGVCLWSTNRAAEKKFGDYPVSTDTLPVSQKLKDKMEYLIKKHDEALNWNDPSGDLLWDKTQIQEFKTAAEKVYRTLCDELGDDYEIELYEHMF